MANIKSQIKRIKQNERSRLRNKAMKAELRTRVKNAITETSEAADTAKESVRQAIKRLDQAAAKGIIHKNQASNRKSRLVKRLSKLS